MPLKKCEHGKHKYYCKICGVGKRICEHGKVKYYCKKLEVKEFVNMESIR